MGPPSRLRLRLSKARSMVQGQQGTLRMLLMTVSQSKVPSRADRSLVAARSKEFSRHGWLEADSTASQIDVLPSHHSLSLHDACWGDVSPAIYGERNRSLFSVQTKCIDVGLSVQCGVSVCSFTIVAA